MKPDCHIGQGFAQNATSMYKDEGLVGHTGIDSSCGYGSPIRSYWDKEYVYKVLTKENPANDGSGFTGVFTIVEQDGKVFEFLYGHCNPAENLMGKTITKGTVIGTEANNGQVYVGQTRITLEMQKAGDKRGSHRHDQARMLRKDKAIQPNTVYLTSLGGGWYFDGSFYAVPDYNNGLNGCFDWTTIPGQAPRDYFLEMQQAILNFQVDNGITDFVGKPLSKVVYGPKTLRAVKKYV